ncbi:MAG: VCBS repeat-containing protein, partial [Synergistaceae bacterium]|nr:VCBS repeat-containing protein [Synergistaceae bacterium]
AVSLFFSVANFLPAFADPVTIHGQRLAEISDIVKTVTSSDFPEIQKHSLLFFERLTEDSEVVYQPRVFTINNDGSMKKEHVLDAQHLDDRHKTRQTLYPGGDVVQKMDLAISPKRFGMRRNVIYTNSGLVPDSGYYSVTGFQTVESNGVEDAASMTTPTEEAPQWYWGERCMWGNAAMTIKGMEDKDIYVIAHSTTMAQTGDISLYFLAVDRNESGSISSHHITVNGGDQYLGAKAFDFDNRLWAVDVAAGDFDGDGYKNEILLAWNNNDGVYAYVYRITTEDGETLNSGGMMPIIEPIHTGVQSWGLDYAHQSSVVALAGDFDGDGVEEAAVVTRTNGLNLTDMRVKVFKYNSGSWTSGELTAYSDFLGTLKATKADLNGDGQDEIVILVIQDSGGTLYPRLEFWGFNHGSIEPVRAWGCNKGGAGNTSLLGYSIGGNEYNQSFKTAEDFCITAGPLTGVRGHVKLAEDIVISHIDEYASRVFVIPPVLNENRDFIAFGDTKKIYEDTTVDSARRGGVITSDFANESLMLDTPTHTQDNHDESYVVVLQSLPYHIDNVLTDGSLSDKPENYTYSGFGDMAGGIKGQMRVAYWNGSSNSQEQSVSFGLASTTETVSLLGDAGEFAAGYLKFRATEANIAGNFDSRAKAAADAYNSIMNFVTDKIDSTTTNASSSANKVSIESGFDARFHDKFITYTAPQHIWRYKILNKPLPSWYVLGPKADFVSKDFSNAESQDRYISFSMYDTATLGTCEADSHSDYNARHENGNFFSYPSKVEDIEGYSEGGKLISQPYRTQWSKDGSNMGISFEQSEIESQSYDTHYQKSELTKTVSAIASFFGAEDPSPMPPYTSHSETFVKQYSTKESISVDIFGRTDLKGEAASHMLIVMPYTTREGTMKVGTAVELNDVGKQDSPVLWRSSSRYSQYPDPALVLPNKYLINGTTIEKADSITAAKMRGVRFYVPSLDLDSDNRLLGGLQYKIRVPVYNASFMKAENFTVSLSYFADNEVNLAAPNTSFKKNPSPLHHIDTVTMSLEGWQNGSSLNKGWAEFTWNVPEDLNDGMYYLYAQIDPEHGMIEVHESRLTSNDAVLDIGGNNEGHFRFYYTAPATLVNKNAAHTSASFKAASHTGNGTILRTAYRSGEADGGN